MAMGNLLLDFVTLRLNEEFVVTYDFMKCSFSTPITLILHLPLAIEESFPRKEYASLVVLKPFM